MSLPVYLAQGHAEGECVPGDSYLGGDGGDPQGCLSVSLSHCARDLVKDLHFSDFSFLSFEYLLKE